MSEQEIGKKLVEENELEYFIEAYKFVTNDHLVIVRPGERPDFICQRHNGLQVGVELTKAMRDPETAHAEEIMFHQQFMDCDTALDNIWEAIASKDKKRSQGNWRCADNTILVIQLFDCQIEEIETLLDQTHYESFGFVEIWLADYSGLEAYRDIELFGLYPSKWWGCHQRQNPFRKPYG